MHLGFAVPLAGSWASPANCVDIAQRAEALGYASLWTFQRLFFPLDGEPSALPPVYRRAYDPLSVLAYLAGKTEAIRLGVGAVIVPSYHPLVLAKTLTTIDHLSDGRLDVGLGTGSSPQELASVGAVDSERAPRLVDFVRCLRAIWTDEVVDYEGRFYRVPRSQIDPKPLQRPGPPLLLGGVVDSALRRAGRMADGWVAGGRTDLSRIDEFVATVRSGAEDAGRDPDDVRIVLRGVVKVREGERAPLVGSYDDISSDLAGLAQAGVTETFVDLNFDPEIGSPDADPAESMRRAHETLEALAPVSA